MTKNIYQANIYVILRAESTHQRIFFGLLDESMKTRRSERDVGGHVDALFLGHKIFSSGKQLKRKLCDILKILKTLIKRTMKPSGQSQVL